MKFYFIIAFMAFSFSAQAVGSSQEADTVKTETVPDVKTSQREMQKHLKAARQLSNIAQSPNFANARKEIQACMDNPLLESYLAEVYMEAGNVEYNCYEVERNKPAKGGKIDYTVLYPVTVNGFYYLDKAYDLYVENGGKSANALKPQIQKKAWNLFNSTDGFRANAANAFENKDWMNARHCFDLFAKAIDSKVINDYAASNPKVKPLLAQYKNDSIVAHAKYFRAISSIYSGDKEQAILDLEDIKYDGFEQNVVLQELCSLYRETGKESEFVDLLEEGVILLPDEPWYARNLVNVYLDKKDYKVASEIIDKLINVDPNNSENLMLKGQLVELIGDVDEAQTYFERSYALNPNTTEINSHLGRLWFNRATKIEGDLFEQRRFDDALTESLPLYTKAADYYQRAFELDDQHLDKTIAKAIRTVRYKQFTQAGCPNKNELIEQYNKVSTAYGLSVFPK